MSERPSVLDAFLSIYENIEPHSGEPEAAGFDQLAALLLITDAIHGLTREIELLRLAIGARL